MKMSQPGIAKEATAPHNFYGFEYQNGAFLIGTYRHFFWFVIRRNVLA